MLVQAAGTAQIRIVGQVDLIVRAVDCGWLIDCPALGPPLAFFSGAKAEAKAHELGRVMAAAGHDVRVEVRDRTQKIIGATSYPALPAACVLSRIGVVEGQTRIV